MIDGPEFTLTVYLFIANNHNLRNIYDFLDNNESRSESVGYQGVDLEFGIFWELRNSDADPCRSVRLEIFAVDLVHSAEIAHALNRTFFTFKKRVVFITSVTPHPVSSKSRLRLSKALLA